MPVSFDWDFTEESKAGEPGGGPSPRRWGPWRRAAVVLIVLLLVGSGLGLWARSRLRVVEKREAELRAVVELELKTIAEGDVELFRSLQDPKDASWREQQVERYISAQASQFSPAPGLVLAERSMDIGTVHYFGATGRAELERWFEDRSSTTRGEGGSGKLVHFRLTWFYAQGEDGEWYHIAPPEGYWGIPYAWYGSRLVIRATEVEARWIDPLADELVVLIARACRWLGCPEDVRYTLNFMDMPAPEVQGDWWVVPTLYLAGIPEDDGAREAWRRALKLWVVEALASAQVENDEARERLIYEQLVMYLKAELGLIDPSVPDRGLLAKGVRAGNQAALWSLWQAKLSRDDAEGNRLLVAEMTALLAFMEEQVGDERVFQLLPALDAYVYLGDAVSELYGLNRTAFMTDWFDYLSELTGEPVLGQLPRPLSTPEPLQPPAVLQPAMPPGDQVALLCDGRVWVGNADGSDVAPLTLPGARFDGVSWSPDGRWLLAGWTPVRSSPIVPYLLAPDGSTARLLSDDPSVYPMALDWDPEGWLAVMVRYQGAVQFSDVEPEIYTLDLETDRKRPLPGMPAWSPDGRRVAYQRSLVGQMGGEIWLADVAGEDWENARQITDAGAAWSGYWSPDSASLALVLVNARQEPSGVAVYDVATGRLSPALTGADVAAAVKASSGGFVTDEDADPAGIPHNAFEWVLPAGWAADGRHLLLTAQGTRSNSISLVAAPLEVFQAPSGVEDASRPLQVLAYAPYQVFYGASWSPTDPRRLAFTWLSRNNPGPGGPWGTSFVLDLQVGVVFSRTETMGATWSPDGNWLAMPGAGRVMVLDTEGHEAASIVAGESGGCEYLAWNPAADLSDLREP